jgi:SH3 domain-containing protein
VGAAVYFVITLLFSHALNLSGNDDRKTSSALPVISANPTGTSVAPTSDIELQKGANVQQRMATSDTRQHAISLDGPATEAPTISPSSSPSRSEEANSPGEAAQETSTNQKPEILAVTAPTIVRNAPSETAQQIGTAQRGAQLQVIERDHEWLHFLDPSSGNKGWIQSSFVAAPRVDNHFAQTDVPVDTASPNTAKRKPKIFTQEQPHSKTLPKPQAKAYAGLPPDEEFLPRRMRAPGFLNRRRMFGEGLMSPGFLPPE